MRHVCIALLGVWLGEACGVAHDLRELAARSVIAWSEVGPVERSDAGLIGLCAAWIASHVPPVGEAVDPDVEGAGVVYILEDLGSRVLKEAC